MPSAKVRSKQKLSLQFHATSDLWGVDHKYRGHYLLELFSILLSTLDVNHSIILLLSVQIMYILSQALEIFFEGLANAKILRSVAAHIVRHPRSSPLGSRRHAPPPGLRYRAGAGAALGSGCNLVIARSARFIGAARFCREHCGARHRTLFRRRPFPRTPIAVSIADRLARRQFPQTLSEPNRREYSGRTPRRVSPPPTGARRQHHCRAWRAKKRNIV